MHVCSAALDESPCNRGTGFVFGLHRHQRRLVCSLSRHDGPRNKAEITTSRALLRTDFTLWKITARFIRSSGKWHRACLPSRIRSITILLLSALETIAYFLCRDLRDWPLACLPSSILSHFALSLFAFGTEVCCSFGVCSQGQSA